MGTYSKYADIISGKQTVKAGGTPPPAKTSGSYSKYADIVSKYSAPASTTPPAATPETPAAPKDKNIFEKLKDVATGIYNKISAKPAMMEKLKAVETPNVTIPQGVVLPKMDFSSLAPSQEANQSAKLKPEIQEKAYKASAPVIDFIDKAASGASLVLKSGVKSVIDTPGNIIKSIQDDKATTKKYQTQPGTKGFIQNMFEESVVPTLDRQKTSIEQKLQKNPGTVSDKDVAKLEAITKILEMSPDERFKNALVIKNITENIKSERRAKAAATGLIGTVNSLYDGSAWLAGKSKNVKILNSVSGKFENVMNAGSDNLDAWIAVLAPENPTFEEQIYSGAGSSLPFFAIGAGFGKGSQFLMKVSPKIAAWFGGSAAGAVEAMSESGTVYDENLKKDKTKKEADDAANKVFGANIVLNILTDRFGVFSEDKIGIKKLILSSSGEGIQEATQQVISNVNTDRPYDEGVFDSGVIGAIIGTGMGSVGTMSETQTGDEKASAQSAEPPVPPEVPPGAVDITEQVKSEIPPGATEITDTSIPTSPEVAQPETLPVASETAPVETKALPVDKKSEIVDILVKEKKAGNTAFLDKMVERTKNSPALRKALNQVIKEANLVIETEKTTKIKTKAEKAPKVTVEKKVTSPKAVKQTKTVPVVPTKVVKQVVYQGKNKQTTKFRKTWSRVLTVKTSQAELIKRLANEGNKAAKKLYDSMPNKNRVDFTVADPIIQKAFKDKYDAVQYDNTDRKQVGTEWHDLKTNSFFAKNETTAKLYAMQSRSAKYKDDTTKEIKKYIDSKKTKFRENPDKYDLVEQGKAAGLDYDYRRGIPNFRGEVTQAKILRVLKNRQSDYGELAFNKEILKFGSAEELASHLFYHGSGGGISNLKAGIALGDTANFGGGYGEKYWGISLSKNRNRAAQFVGQSRYGNVAPVILKKGAKVIEMPEIEDAVELEDHIVQLWKDGVDAVKIGDWNSEFSEQELVVLNPKAIVVGKPESYAVFNQPKMPSFNEEQIIEMYDSALARYSKVSDEEHARFVRQFEEKYGRKPDGMIWDSRRKRLVEFVKNKPALVSSTKEIEDYISGKKTKFRTDPTAMFPDVVAAKNQVDLAIIEKGKQRITSKFLLWPDIKNKTEATWQYLQQTANAGSLALKATEKEIVQKVLDTQFSDYKTNGKKIPMAQFNDALIDSMMSLDVIQSNTYADYGSDAVMMSGLDHKTYILNSPYEHGKTGHFSSDFTRDIDETKLEIKEIPPQEGNPRVKFAVINNDVTLTEENVQENVYTVANTREEAQKWIDDHVMGGTNNGRIIKTQKQGLFGHFRTFDTNDGRGENPFISHIAEIQSDVYQDGRLKQMGVTGNKLTIENQLNNAKEMLKVRENQLKSRQEEIAKIEAKVTTSVAEEQQKKTDINYQERDLKTIKDDIEQATADVKLYQSELDEFKLEVPANEKLFLGYKSTWQERLVREAINIKANEGIKTIRFATPRTIAFIEGYTSNNEDGDYLPYETQDGSTEDLTFGDTIDYGGEEFTVVDISGRDITVAPSDKVNHFNADEAMSEDIDSRISDARSGFENVEEDFGTIDTPEKAQKVIDSLETLNKLSKFNSKAKDAENRKERYADSTTESEFRKDKEKAKEEITLYTKFIDLIKGGIANKEGINADTIHDLSFKDKLEEKYGIPHSYWNYYVTPFNSNYPIYDGLGEVAVPINPSVEQVDKYLLEKVLPDQLDKAKSNLETAELALVEGKEQLETDLKEINDRVEPTKEELKDIPKSAIEAATRSSWGYSIEYEVEQILGKMAESEEESVSFDDFEDDLRDSLSENYDADYEGIYGDGHVFIQDNYGGGEVWTVEEGADTENFMQPDQYEEMKPNEIEDFKIEDYESDQATVLRFYDQQIIPYLQKLRKGNVELVTDDDGFQWWETKVMPEDVHAPLAYRIKEDMAAIGLNITDAQEKEIMDLNLKIFGDQNIKVTEQILANSQALGLYRDNMIKILAKQVNPKDTFYHEAVHKYLDTFLNRNDHIELLREAQAIYGLKDLAQVEEKLAEDFITYAKKREGVVGQIRRFFDKIFVTIKKYLKNTSKVETLYADIISGKAAAEEAKNKALTQEQIDTFQPLVDIAREVKNAKLESKIIDKVLAEPVSTRGTKVKISESVRRLGDLLGLELADERYKPSENRSQIRKAEKYIAEHPLAAKQVAFGTKTAPKGILEEAIRLVYIDKAEVAGDMDTLAALATVDVLSGRRTAQELQIRRARNPDSIMSRLQEIITAKEEVIEKRFGKSVSKIISEETAKLKESIKSSQPKISDWNSFIESIKCK
jgi:hypothetical protein